jgi:hypothetical protein
MKLWRLLKIEGSVLIYMVPRFGPTYIGERRTTFAKAHGLEVRCLIRRTCWGTHCELGEHVANPLGT